jgi:hypothetical protein
MDPLLRLQISKTGCSRSVHSGHQESFVAVSFPTCSQIIAAILERPAIELILTHLTVHPQPRLNGRSARRPGPIARVARLRPSLRATSGRHTTPQPDSSGLGALAVLDIAFVGIGFGVACAGLS